ncbi:MAG: hypothetical protein RR338_04020 [Clostridia bacterium]
MEAFFIFLLILIILQAILIIIAVPAVIYICIKLKRLAKDTNYICQSIYEEKNQDKF